MKTARVSRALIYRILDANFNRSREGLRVCEEVARFVLDDKALTRRLKTYRHAVSGIWKQLLEEDPAILASRDVRKDVGRGASVLENHRADFKALFAANCQRVKESMRALEESVKLLEPKYAEKFKRIRFGVYAVEKRIVPRLEALRDHVPGISGRPVANRARPSSDPRRRGRRSITR